MYMWKKVAMTTAFAALAGTTAMASCGIDAGRVSIVGNEFPAIQTVAAAAAACGSDAVEVKSNLTADHQKINLAGMQGNPAEYTTAIIANSSIIALMNDDVIRPLDDLIAAHGADIPAKQLITINGKVMAVAFMANAQTLAYRADVLKEIGVEPPKSYEEMLAAAEMIREKGIMENPIGGAYAAGWNLAEEFVNMYIGTGGEFFTPGTAEVSINNEKGVAALEMMKSLTAYMNPDYLTHDSNGTQAEWEAGNVALMSMWGSRMGNLMDTEGSEPVVYENTMVGGPLMVGDSGVPATTLWWDGWTVAKNVSDEDATATFLAMKEGTGPSILNDTTMAEAVWMIDGYEPAPVSAGVFAAIAAGSQPYPMLPFMGLLHTAAGDNIADFLQGKESAEQALADIEAAYTAAATENGFLK
ncbi:MAG: extracellular solute-binding protein [Yoonia sp.]|jgi:ABC-type glycerol-3-phosphate transport system substrate-binding protein